MRKLNLSKVQELAVVHTAGQVVGSIRNGVGLASN